MPRQRKTCYCLKIDNHYFYNVKMGELLENVNEILESEYRGLIVLSRNVVFNLLTRPHKVNKSIKRNIKVIYGDKKLKEENLKELLDNLE